MNPTIGNSVLITGANTGLGKEAARQLATSGKYDTIFLACRNLDKARAAQKDLQQTSGMSVFEILRVDTTDHGSIRGAISAIDKPLRAVLLNAGGAGGPSPMTRTVDGVTTLFAANILGHVVLLESLISQDLLTSAAVLVGSEAARGAPVLRIKRPQFSDYSVAEFRAAIDGSIFGARGADSLLAYGQVKYIGALYMSALARRHPHLRLLTVSPGNTAGTEAYRDMAPPVRILLQRVLVPYVATRFGIAHPLEVGARRLTTAIEDDSMVSGRFYASPGRRLTGPVTDQSTAFPEFNDHAIQEHAYEAIHSFIPEPQL